MKKIWLRKLDKVSDGVKFINGPRRYSLEWTEYPKQIMLPDGTYTECLELEEYFENDEGELVRAYPGVPIYVSLETLMSYFIIDDSNVGRYVKDLEDFKDTSLKESAKHMNKGFTELCETLYGNDQPNISSDIKEVTCSGQALSYAEKVTDIDLEVEHKINENERNTENIHTLHSGESETNEERPAE